jgi:hypothetical protein
MMDEWLAGLKAASTVVTLVYVMVATSAELMDKQLVASMVVSRAETLVFLTVEWLVDMMVVQ